MTCLYIFESNPLLVASFENIFFHSVCFLFILFVVSFDVQRASLVAQMIKIHLQCRTPEFDPWVGKTPWKRE